MCNERMLVLTKLCSLFVSKRVAVAVDHYEPYIDFEELMRRTQSSNTSFNEPGGVSLEDLRSL